MSVVRIDNPQSHTLGYQARAYVAPGRKPTRFFSDRQCGGAGKAWVKAWQCELELQRKAEKLRRTGKAA